MAVTAYATVSELDRIWSEFGVTVRADHDADGDADDGIIDGVLEEATTEVNAYLLERYTVAVCAASAWVKWATAHIAAELLGESRGNPVPQTIHDRVEKYRAELTLIRDGRRHLKSDTGLATPRNDSRPAVTNFSIDGRYSRAKVRRIPATSTGPEQSGTLERHDERYPYFE